MNLSGPLKNNTELLKKPAYVGFIKIWQSNPKTGESKLLVDKKNTILYTAADILAKAIGGDPYAKISHMYLGYTNDTPPVDPIDPSSTLFTLSGGNPDYGYIRVPLAFNPSYSAETNYDNNIVIFTTILSNTTGLIAQNGVNPPPATLTSGVSQIYECALASAFNPSATASSHEDDKPFSRVTFTPIVYDSGFNLTVSWGIKFVS